MLCKDHLHVCETIRRKKSNCFDVSRKEGLSNSSLEVNGVLLIWIFLWFQSVSSCLFSLFIQTGWQVYNIVLLNDSCLSSSHVSPFADIWTRICRRAWVTRRLIPFWICHRLDFFVHQCICLSSADLLGCEIGFGMMWNHALISLELNVPGWWRHCLSDWTSQM